MRIEVSEKEAKEIYTSRYASRWMDKYGKSVWLLFVVGLIVTILLLLMSLAMDWSGWLVFLCVTPLIPALFLSRRISRQANKEAEKQLKDNVNS